jgi:hypothetical protein
MTVNHKLAFFFPFRDISLVAKEAAGCRGSAKFSRKSLLSPELRVS